VVAVEPHGGDGRTGRAVGPQPGGAAAIEHVGEGVRRVVGKQPVGKDRTGSAQGELVVQQIRPARDREVVVERGRTAHGKRSGKRRGAGAVHIQAGAGQSLAEGRGDGDNREAEDQRNTRSAFAQGYGATRPAKAGAELFGEFHG